MSVRNEYRTLRSSWLACVLFSVLVGCGGSSGSPTPDADAGVEPIDASDPPPPRDGGPDGSSDAAADSSVSEDASSSSDASSSTCSCDDAIPCTIDTCEDGVCEHLARTALCGAFQYCTVDAGCVDGPACASEDDCERPDVCTTTACDPQQRKCRYAVLDGDQDSDAPLVCGGGDCNDDDARVNSHEAESCNLVDDDCDGEIDPPKASGCAADRSCEAGSCECDGSTLPCGPGGQCIDVMEDEAYCGSCIIACLSGQACEEGECRCPDGENVCDASCVDLDTDELHCGDCVTACDEGEACVGGDCGCAATTTDCDEGDALDCRDLTSDANHCNACGASCLRGSKCESSSCETTVTWARLFGAPGSTSNVFNHHFPLARSPSGEIYAGLEMNAGAHRELPDGAFPLWTTARGIAKFDAAGNFVWHEASTAEVEAVAFAGGSVWAAGHGTSDVTVAGTTFTVPAGSNAVTWVVQLDPANGDVLGSRKLDYEAHTVPFLELIVDSSGELWLLHTAQNGFTEGLATYPPVDNNHASFLFRFSDDMFRWLPGFLPSHQIDSLGNLVIKMGSLPYDEDFTFGGDTLNGHTTAQYAVVRFAPDLTHLNSFLTPEGGRLGTTAAGILLIDQYNEPFIQRFAYSGISATKDLEAADEAPITARGSITAGGRVFVYGRTLANSYEGRALGANRAYVAAYDEETLALERLAAVSPNTGNYASVTNIAVDATGTEVTLALAFSDYVTLGDETIESGDESVGLALVRLHMP